MSEDWAWRDRFGPAVVFDHLSTPQSDTCARRESCVAEQLSLIVLRRDDLDQNDHVQTAEILLGRTVGLVCFSVLWFHPECSVSQFSNALCFQLTRVLMLCVSFHLSSLWIPQTVGVGVGFFFLVPQCADLWVCTDVAHFDGGDFDDGLRPGPVAAGPEVLLTSSRWGSCEIS